MADSALVAAFISLAYSPFITLLFWSVGASIFRKVAFS